MPKKYDQDKGPNLQLVSLVLEAVRLLSELLRWFV